MTLDTFRVLTVITGACITDISKARRKENPVEDRVGFNSQLGQERQFVPYYRVNLHVYTNHFIKKTKMIIGGTKQKFIHS